MKVVSVNINGIRAGHRKGLFDWLAELAPDVVCIQETKAQISDLSDPVFHPEGYHCYYHDAQKRGYSGVAIYLKQKPERVTRGLGWPCADDEGRYIQADCGNLSIASLYLPSGSAKVERQALKFDFMARYAQQLEAMRDSGRSWIICGDWNIVHKEIDIKNFKANQKNSGCLPQERAWLDTLFGEMGWVDGFRVINQAPSEYTWWSNRGRSWDNNVGWRIDYQVITSDLRDKVRAASIYKDQRFSDHAPLVMEYDVCWGAGE